MTEPITKQPNPACQPGEPARIEGLAQLHKAAVTGTSLTSMIEACTAQTPGASEFMTLAMIFLMTGNPDAAADLQARALTINPWYRINQPTNPDAIRLLVVMQPGFMQDNTPIDFVLQDPDIRMDWWFVPDGNDLPPDLPDHDILLTGLGESTRIRPQLERMAQRLRSWPHPVINRPEHIVRLARHQLPQLLAHLPMVHVPPTLLLDRSAVAAMSRDGTLCQHLGIEQSSPWLIRPLDTHGGHGLHLVRHPADLESALAETAASHFHVAPFVDYRSADGLYRKCRLALCNGRAFAGHLAISEHWMVHYKNAGMAEHDERRQEEQVFMERFDEDFARRHAPALTAIAERSGLDYVVMDCAELPDGRLLVFELDNRGFMHAIDPSEQYAWKPAVMQKLFDAFASLLKQRARSGINPA